MLSQGEANGSHSPAIPFKPDVRPRTRQGSHRRGPGLELPVEISADEGDLHIATPLPAQGKDGLGVAIGSEVKTVLIEAELSIVGIMNENEIIPGLREGDIETGIDPQKRCIGA